jgi:predicted acyl esterase
MYCDRDFRTKRALEIAVKMYKDGVGAAVRLWRPGRNSELPQGWLRVEGPYYPREPTWSANVLVESGVIIRVK